MCILTASNVKESLQNATAVFLKQIECRQNLKVPVHILSETINLVLTQMFFLLTLLVFRSHGDKLSQNLGKFQYKEDEIYVQKYFKK